MSRFPRAWQVAAINAALAAHGLAPAEVAN
jgi:hypothetical protein